MVAISESSFVIIDRVSTIITIRVPYILSERPSNNPYTSEEVCETLKQQWISFLRTQPPIPVLILRGKFDMILLEIG